MPSIWVHVCLRRAIIYTVLGLYIVDDSIGIFRVICFVARYNYHNDK